jgi:hypothetical protein
MFAGFKMLVMFGLGLLLMPVQSNSQGTLSGPFTLSSTWVNIPVPLQTGSFRVEFNATPSIAPLDGVIGFSSGSANAYSALATIVRFNSVGFIDARSGADYSAQTQIPYVSNSRYHFRLEINVAAHTYSIFVTPQGGGELLVGSNFGFRSDQVSVSQLNNLSGQVSSSGTISLSDVIINGSLNQSPVVRITSPTSGSSFVAPATFNITADATDSDGQVAKVDFYNGETLLGSDSTSPFSFTLTGLPAGGLTLVARATDGGGAIAVSSPVSVSVVPTSGGSSNGATLRIGWDPSISPDVVGYRFYLGTSSRNYSATNNIGNVTTHSITNLERGRTYYFAVTSISSSNLESDYSEEISWRVPELNRPSLTTSFAGSSLTLSGRAEASKLYIVQQSTNLVEWETLTNVVSDAQGNLVFNSDTTLPLLFFRLSDQ